MEVAFLPFGDFFAVNAEFCGRARFQAADADFFAAFFAPAEVFAGDAVQRAVNFVQQFAFAVAGAQFQREFFFLRGAVVEVGRRRAFVA